ncbi:MAG: class I SAM-dependent methyltransferase [Fibrobacteria bacterium]|nr:class I SAM-dependent methyltransferase [Fibrobacteria bacterium]
MKLITHKSYCSYYIFIMPGYYDTHADDLFRRYESVKAEAVHDSWRHFLPKTHSLILDIGAGSGRDAAWLASLGHEVIAVEPCDKLRGRGEEAHYSKSIRWLSDTLPALKKIRKMDCKFDVILLSGVWMHIAPGNRKRAFRVFSNLLKSGGLLVMSCRSVRRDNNRDMYPVDFHQLDSLAVSNTLEKLLDKDSGDSLGRNDVIWNTSVYRMPDDGTGAMPLLRHIIVNDDKSSTYKMALLRVLLRIADGARGAVLEEDDQYVSIPVGLVSLYWVRQYKQLILEHDFIQGSRGNSHVAFNKDAFKALKHISPYDLQVGSFFQGNDAVNVARAVNLCRNIIAQMPAHFITFPGDSTQVFQVEKYRFNCPDSIRLDLDYLSSFGVFKIPVNVWEALTRYACWIEPAVVKEWVSLMQTYHKKQGQKVSAEKLNTALTWLEPERNTGEVRKMVERCRAKGKSVHCVWTGTKLRNDFAVDHCFPFAHWPNNDLWNLLPSTSTVNNKKSARLPSAEKLFKAREIMVDWWGMAYSEDFYRERFTREAELALPVGFGVGGDFDKVYDGMQAQRVRLKTDQQLVEWG